MGSCCSGHCNRVAPEEGLIHADGQLNGSKGGTDPAARPDAVNGGAKEPAAAKERGKQKESALAPFLVAAQKLLDLVKAQEVSTPQGRLADLAAASRALQKEALQWLEKGGEGGGGSTSNPSLTPAQQGYLQACAEVAAGLADAALQPLVSQVERALTHCSTTSSSLGGGRESWTALDMDGIIAALEAAGGSVYGEGGLRTACEAARPAMELLLALHRQGRRKVPGPLPTKPSVFLVPALNTVASMVVVVFFRHVGLEGQASIQAKVENLMRLLKALGLTEGEHGGGGGGGLFAVGLEPGVRALFVGLVQAAAGGGELKLKIHVTRSRVFWDAFDEASGQKVPPFGPSSSSAQAYKIFPSFVDEWTSGPQAGGQAEGGGQVALEAGEGHGPRKEFFALAAAGMTGLDNVSKQGGRRAGEKLQPGPLFTYTRAVGAFWYNTALTESPSLSNAYRFAGWLIGQSLVNHASLGLALQPVLIGHLLAGVTASLSPSSNLSLADLEAFDPDAAAGVAKAARLPASEFASYLEMEGLPRQTSPAQYICHAIHTLMVEEAKWQAHALAEGFSRAVDIRVLEQWCLDDAKALAAAVAGPWADREGKEDGAIDFRKTFRVVMDNELLEEEAVLNLGDLFWEVVESWPGDRQRQLLEFVTGSSHPPLAGSELLRIEAPFVAFGMEEYKAQLGMLPQAHTCDNLLELPNYLNALLQVQGYRNLSNVPLDKIPDLRAECIRIIDDRLTLAATCVGYGLDDRG